MLRSDADGAVRGRRKNLSGEIAERELTEKTGEPDNCQIGSGLVQFIGSEAGLGDRPQRVIFAHSTSALAKKPEWPETGAQSVAYRPLLAGHHAEIALG